jgi:hypothetical protein
MLNTTTERDNNMKEYQVHQCELNTTPAPVSIITMYPETLFETNAIDQAKQYAFNMHRKNNTNYVVFQPRTQYYRYYY